MRYITTKRPVIYGYIQTIKLTQSFITLNLSQLSGGPDSSVGIATNYGLEGPGIESRWRRDFPHLSRPAPGAQPASCTMGTVFFPGVKNGRDVTLTPYRLLVSLFMKE